ncbi:polysaccharide pyruvyl transferase family protein [Pararhizobium gei]|uniref:polysaccharide pyruvyl transferase family protein n=1 Tax=Pararhizobium gei TaxID=1395951 RepID=UPI0023DAD5FD|nr:polysaccharide pyruvyl transferase family protein [Rhizobium gei]
MSWVWTTQQHPDANLGDALSAVMVSAISGLKIDPSAFNQKSERMTAVGTIGHAQRGGKVHVWGTGFDLNRDPTGAVGEYRVPEDTTLVVHAVRGKQTAAGLRKLGVDVPDIFGDPVWFLPRIFPFASLEKKYELGVIVHISELDEATAQATVRKNLLRYNIPLELSKEIKIINTYTGANLAGMHDKIEEIVSCRRILSTSLHGLVIAETYNIPCAWFSTNQGESGFLPIDGSRPIDHRMIDFYGGVDRDAVLSYLHPHHKETAWEKAIAFIDTHWQPLTYTGEALFNAFPLKHAVRFQDNVWNCSPEVLQGNRY